LSRNCGDEEKFFRNWNSDDEDNEDNVADAHDDHRYFCPDIDDLTSSNFRRWFLSATLPYLWHNF